MRRFKVGSLATTISPFRGFTHLTPSTMSCGPHRLYHGTFGFKLGVIDSPFTICTQATQFLNMITGGSTAMVMPAYFRANCFVLLAAVLAPAQAPCDDHMESNNAVLRRGIKRAAHASEDLYAQLKRARKVFYRWPRPLRPA